MIRTKQWGSTLHNISKKRQAEIDAGTWKPKPRKPIRQISKKSLQRIKTYRETCFEKWGCKCFLCGRIDNSCKTLDSHHIFGRTNGDNPEHIVPLCNRFTGCKAHNHNGMDRRFHELQEQILKKMEGKNGEKTNL